MNPTELPKVVQGVSSLAIFALGISMVAVHTLLIAWAARRSTISPRAQTVAPLISGAFLAVWLAMGLLLGDGAHFPLVAGPSRRLLSLAVGFGPVLVALALLYGSKTLRVINAEMPPEWLIRVQTYRMAGLMFLYPFLYFGVVPAGFAIPAAVGDFLTGLAAPWVASAVERRRPGARAWAVAWNAFGLLDLIVAPFAAVLSHAQVLTTYPLVLVPLFIGPPLGILTHLYSLRNLSLSARTGSIREPTVIADVLRAS